MRTRVQEASAKGITAPGEVLRYSRQKEISIHRGEIEEIALWRTTVPVTYRIFSNHLRFDGWPRAIERKRRWKRSEVTPSQVLLKSEIVLAMRGNKEYQRWRE